MIESITAYIVLATLMNSKSVELNGSIIIDDMRMIVMQNMALMSIFISHPIPSSLNVTNVVDETTTNPLLSDLSHLSTDPVFIKDILTKSVQFVHILTNKLESRDNTNNIIITGDQTIDNIYSGRILSKKSGLIDLMFKQTSCIQDIEGDCDDPTRIYVYGEIYAGLSALLEDYLIMCLRLSKSKFTTRTYASSPSEVIDLDHLTIRYSDYE
ncbi:MAG: hypothetical protein EZS28_018367 [Streblomastix strix]|uniref:Uncharacterized protein n=1 Tax=Streblomastix strix TaxID=222440 RepID=A0A5J4VU44_9EUKA|nr:MAG: hypothetical protein EZS28_018367 [Streblomastix strix]